MMNVIMSNPCTWEGSAYIVIVIFIKCFADDISRIISRKPEAHPITQW